MRQEQATFNEPPQETAPLPQPPGLDVGITEIPYDMALYFCLGVILCGFFLIKYLGKKG